MEYITNVTYRKFQVLNEMKLELQYFLELLFSDILMKIGNPGFLGETSLAEGPKSHQIPDHSL